MTELENQYSKDLTIEELIREANALLESMIQASERILYRLSLIRSRQPFLNRMSYKFYLVIRYLDYRFTFLCNHAFSTGRQKEKIINQ